MNKLHTPLYSKLISFNDHKLAVVTKEIDAELFLVLWDFFEMDVYHDMFTGDNNSAFEIK
jgi:hypothetical protein